jgi:hypothetical protein
LISGIDEDENHLSPSLALDALQWQDTNGGEVDDQQETASTRQQARHSEGVLSFC